MDDLERQVRALVHEQLPWLPCDLATDADLVKSAGIYGDDAWEFLETFATRFHVRMDGFLWYHHSDPEGCNPFWLIFRPWWLAKTYVPIRLRDLIDAACTGTWCVKYPAG